MELVNYQGWRLLEPPVRTDELSMPERSLRLANSDPVIEEFGHACHGCAKYPCEKSSNGEPADCWEYIKKGDEP